MASVRKLSWLILGALLLGAAATLLHCPRRPQRAHSVTLTWQPPAATAGAEVVSYNIYRGTLSGGPYAPLASGLHGLTYQDGLVQAGMTYYYVVRSVDAAGRESRPSEEVKATVSRR